MTAPLILATNSVKDTGYNVDNSVRLDPGSTPHMAVTQGTPTNVDKYTFSIWVKRTDIGSANSKIFSVSSGSATGEEKLEFNQDDVIWRQTDTSGNTSWERVTDRKLRDASAWYNIIVAYDSSQGTAADRCKMYINGVQETSFSGDSNPSSNQDSYTNTSGRSLKFFALHSSLGTQTAGGYYAEMVYIDGQQLDQTSFGEFDSDSPNVWKPINVSGLTFGNNGFYCEFKDSSALGTDTSGNSNNLSTTNFSATDQTTDTCTNNFAIINVNDNYWASSTITQGGTKVSTASSAEAMNTSTFAMTKGKWYMEVDNISGAGAQICGITPTPSFQTSSHGKSGDVTPHTISYIQSGKVQEGNGSGGQTDLATYASYGNGNIIGIYMDLDNMKAYLSKDGSLQSSTGIDLEPLASNGTGHYMFFVGDNNAGARVCEANFGNGFQSLSSAVADDNGHGAFEYSPNITGDGEAKKFFACCSKNLAEFG